MNQVSKIIHLIIISAYYLIEEAFYAALDIKQLDWANAFLRIITTKFIQSVKSMRMLGMLYEAL